MLRVAALLALVMVSAVSGASADPSTVAFPRGSTSFPTPRLGWVPNYTNALPSCVEVAVCATDDGGRKWRTVFADPSPNVELFIRTPVRTSSLAGVVLAGRASFPYWTRTGGRTWFRMERPPAPSPGLIDPTPPSYQGRGEFLFLHYGGRTLYRVVPWPPPSEPPCARRATDFPTFCGLPPDNGGLEYRPIHTLASDAFGPMANVPGGVVALVTADDGRLPVGILLHRHGVTTVRRLPPSSSQSLAYDVRVAAAWPWLFVIAHHREAFWWSRDGGETWRVEPMAPRYARASRGRPAIAAKAPLAGGWIAAARGHVAVAIEQAGRTRTVWLPQPYSGRCRTALDTPRADWTVLYVESRSRRVRWWSDDGGRHWTVSGRC